MISFKSYASGVSVYDTILQEDDFVVPYFKAKELCCPLTKEIVYSVEVLDKFSELRNTVNFPLRVNSACRSEDYNNAIGGHSRSLHLLKNPKHNILGSAALDISVRWWDKEKLSFFLDTAKTLGFSIGHGYVVGKRSINGFIHLDLRVLADLPRADFTY